LLGKETILECKVTAFPQAVSVWRFQNMFLSNSLKHRIDIYKDKGHTMILSVRIMNITKEDFGQYSCFASNEFGEDEETMTLYGKCPPLGDVYCLFRLIFVFINLILTKAHGK
jgi:neuronal growth regulator 1